MKTRIAVFLVLVAMLATAHTHGNKVAWWPFQALRVEEPGYDKALASPGIHRMIAEINARIPVNTEWSPRQTKELSNALSKR